MKIRLLAAVAALVVASTAGAFTAGEMGARNAMTPDAIKERIKPVGGVCVQGEECKPAGLAAVALSAEGGKARSGEQVVGAACGACHNTGAAGAPKIGDKGAWGPRIAQGEKTLIQHAINGIRAMPARGACGNCSDEEIANAVKHMVAKSK